MTKTLLFVYGTLKQGGSNVHMMGNSTYLGKARMASGTTLYTNGSYPMMVECDKSEEGTGVEGELYEVGPQVLKRLDSFEGHPRFFERKPIALVETTLDGGPITEEMSAWLGRFEAEAYHFKGDILGRRHLGRSFPVRGEN